MKSKKTKFISTNAKATARIASAFAKTLKGGDVVGLIGDLGTGKTTFVQALAKVLGIRERVTSPTFVYMHVHPVRGQRSDVRTLVHVDAYRGDAETLRGIGLEDYLGAPGTVTVIEWADRAKELLPKKTIRVRFRHAGGDTRIISILSPFRGDARRAEG